MGFLRRAARQLEPLAERLFGTSVAVAAAARWRRGGCVVLYYHQVREASAFDHPNMVVRPEAFRAQVALLAERCEVVGPDGVADGRSGRRPKVALTFDDGYRELLAHALPMLAEHGLPSTVYCCSEVVAGRQAFWWDALEFALRGVADGACEVRVGDGERVTLRLPDEASRGYALRLLWDRCAAAPDQSKAANRLLAQLPPAEVPESLYMNAADLRRCRELGAEIGSHGRTHSRLAGRSKADISDELGGSRKDLEEIVGTPVTSVAYPYGMDDSVSPQVTRGAASVGFRTGFTIRAAMARCGDDPLALPRVPVYLRDGSSRFRGKALGPYAGVYDWAVRRMSGGGQ